MVLTDLLLFVFVRECLLPACFWIHRHGTLGGCWIVIAVVWLLRFLSPSPISVVLSFMSRPSFCFYNATNLQIIISPSLLLPDVLPVGLALSSLVTLVAGRCESFFGEPILKRTAEHSVILPCWVYNLSFLL